VNTQCIYNKLRLFDYIAITDSSLQLLSVWYGRNMYNVRLTMPHREARFRSRTRLCGVFGGCSGTGRGFSVSTRVFLASMIPSLLLVHLHKIMTLLRPNGRRLRTWQRSSSFSAIVEHWRKVVDYFYIHSPVKNSNILSEYFCQQVT
jgi:hypothetical protein